MVAMWYARSKKYGEKNVMYDSYGWYNHMLSDSSQMKHMPEVREDLPQALINGTSTCSWRLYLTIP